MKNLLFVLLNVVGLPFLTAQSDLDQFLQDSNITWLKTYEIDVVPHLGIDSNQALGFKHARGELLKFQAQPTGSSSIHFNSDPALYPLLQQAIYDQKISVYKTAALARPMSRKEITAAKQLYKTTTTSTDGTQQTMRMVAQFVKAGDVVGYRQYGVFYYDTSTNSFKASVLAIAPLVYVYHKEKPTQETRTLFWIPVGQLERTDLNDPAIHWVTRVVAHVPNKGIQPTLRQTEAGAWAYFFERLLADATPKVYGTYHLLGDHILPTEVVQNIVQPNNTKKAHQLQFEELKEPCIVQDWIWNHERQQLFVHYLGFAPTVKRKVPKRYFFSQRPLFYIRME